MEHPITPPPELVRQWCVRSNERESYDGRHIATQAARWGADQELEACCKWVEANFGHSHALNLHLFRRPKPLSLKERALAALEQVDEWGVQSVSHFTIHDELVAGVDVIRRALESLPDPQD